MQLLMSKNVFSINYTLNLFVFSIIRICDEEEDIPLHLRVKRTRSVPYTNPVPDTKTKPPPNIDEYVRIFNSNFLFFISIILDIGVQHMFFKLNIQFK